MMTPKPGLALASPETIAATRAEEEARSSSKALRAEETALVQAWHVDLDVEPGILAGLAATLSALEQQRADRFRFELHRNRFIVGRGFLRTVLGRFLKMNPAAMPIGYGPRGKPELVGELARSGWHFNLAHCEKIAVLGLTKAGPIGVDVERVRALPDTDALVARFLSPSEKRLFLELPEHKRAQAFFNLWTRKEAWLKATGEGISEMLSRVEVSFLSDEPPRLVRLPGDVQSPDDWSLHHFELAEQFVGAVVVGARQTLLTWHRWETSP